MSFHHEIICVRNRYILLLEYKIRYYIQHSNTIQFFGRSTLYKAILYSAYRIRA